VAASARRHRRFAIENGRRGRRRRSTPRRPHDRADRRRNGEGVSLLAANGPDSFIWWDWVDRHRDQIKAATLEHLRLTMIAGVDGVPASVKEAADAMGYRPARRFLAIDLRLATPAIIAGLRIATVTTIGLVTVTGLIGLGGYGSLIDDGLKRTFSTPIVVGAGLSVVMAVVLDLGLVVLERTLTPWSRRRTVR